MKLSPALRVARIDTVGRVGLVLLAVLLPFRAEDTGALAGPATGHQCRDRALFRAVVLDRRPLDRTPHVLDARAHSHSGLGRGCRRVGDCRPDRTRCGREICSAELRWVCSLFRGRRPSYDMQARSSRVPRHRNGRCAVSVRCASRALAAGDASGVVGLQDPALVRGGLSPCQRYVRVREHRGHVLGGRAPYHACPRRLVGPATCDTRQAVVGCRGCSHHGRSDRTEREPRRAGSGVVRLDRHRRRGSPGLSCLARSRGFHLGHSRRVHRV